MRMNRKITYVSLVLILVLIGVYFFAIHKDNYREDIIHLNGSEFLRVSWTEFPNSVPYRLYKGNQKKEVLCEGSGVASNEGRPSFHDVFDTNGVTFAKFGGNYIRCADVVMVLNWNDFEEQYEDFSAYLRWIMKNGSFNERNYIAGPMYKYFNDDLARGFVEQFVKEDPSSTFFPYKYSGYEPYKDLYLTMLKERGDGRDSVTPPEDR